MVLSPWQSLNKIINVHNRIKQQEHICIKENYFIVEKGLQCCAITIEKVRARALRVTTCTSRHSEFVTVTAFITT